MPIDYFLRKNYFGDKKGYIAQTSAKASYETKDITTRMLGKGTTLTEADLNATLVLLKESVLEILAEGGSVNIVDWLSFKTSISGVFENLTSTFNPDTNQININIKCSTTFANDLRKRVKVNRVEESGKMPAIKQIHDFGSNTLNSKITVKDMVKLEGINLKFDLSMEDEGIFIISEDGNKELKVTYREDPMNKVLRFVTPDLQDMGTKVYIEIRSRMGTKVLKKGQIEYPLEIST